MSATAAPLVVSSQRRGPVFNIRLLNIRLLESGSNPVSPRTRRFAFRRDAAELRR